MADIIQHLLHHAHLVLGIQPGADALAGTKYSKVIKPKPLYDLIHFIVVMGAGAVGTTKLQIQACDDSSGTNPVAIPFEVCKQVNDGAADLWESAYTAVSAAGYDTPAAANKIHILQVKKEDLPLDQEWVRLKAVEQVDAAMDACVLVLLTGAGYPTMPPKSVFS